MRNDITMVNFDEYIQQGEPQKRERGYAWQTAIGLQAVDGLKPSDYLIETARKHIEGDNQISAGKHKGPSHGCRGQGNCFYDIVQWQSAAETDGDTGAYAGIDLSSNHIYG